MSKEIESFQDSIRRTFIWFSLTPVIAIVFSGIFIFMITWSAYLASSNRSDNEYIADETDRVLSEYYSMITDVEIALAGSSVQDEKDRIYSLLYSHTARFDEIGSLYIVSPEGDVLFSSSAAIPICLIKQRYFNWGVWSSIKRNKGLIGTILYEGALYVTSGVYNGNELKYAIVCAVPSETIASIVNSRNRYCVITDANGWVYLSNFGRMHDSLGQIRGE